MARQLFLTTILLPTILENQARGKKPSGRCASSMAVFPPNCLTKHDICFVQIPHSPDCDSLSLNNPESEQPWPGCIDFARLVAHATTFLSAFLPPPLHAVLGRPCPVSPWLTTPKANSGAATDSTIAPDQTRSHTQPKHS